MPTASVLGKFDFFTPYPSILSDGHSDYDPEEYRLERIGIQAPGGGSKSSAARPWFLADELDLVPRKAVVAIVAHEDTSSANLIASSLTDDPILRAVTFVTNSSMQGTGINSNALWMESNENTGC